MASTHDVTNQPPPLVDFDPLACDPALAGALDWHSAPLSALAELAREAGSGTAREHGRLADLCHPVLHTHDRYGHRIDEVEFHPSWHWLMRRGVAHGLHAVPWAPDAAPGAHLVRAAGFYLWTQVSDPAPQRARRLAGLIALCLPGALLLRYSAAVVAEAFLGSRFGADTAGSTLGVLPAGTDTHTLAQRVTPRLG